MNKRIWKLVGSAGTIGICLFLSGHVSARQFGPLKLDNQIKEWIESADDPRTQYGLIAEQLRKKGLSVEFVVGAANPRFIGIDPALWSKSYDWDFFSKTQAFGRYFCVGQPAKSVTKPTIVVRADEPGDTLVHEFLHHLQSQRSDAVCELYQRMAEATAVSAKDKVENSILEYEVVRFLKENIKFKSPEVQLGNLEKLINYSKSIPMSDQIKINAIYGWKNLNVENLTAELTGLFDQAVKEQKSQDSYAYKGVEIQPTPPKGQQIGQFSILHPMTVTEGDLPLCVSWDEQGVGDHNVAIQTAIAKWNTASKELLGKVMLGDKCKSARKVVIKVDTDSGKVADGILKYGDVTNNQDETVVRTRAKEWLQYKWMVEAMRRQVILEQEASDRPLIAEKLSGFVTNQVAKMKTNFWMHELGHVLGLGHNFAEKSVMNYTQEVELTEYDRDGSNCVFRKKCEPSNRKSPKYKVQVIPSGKSQDSY